MFFNQKLAIPLQVTTWYSYGETTTIRNNQRGS